MTDAAAPSTILAERQLEMLGELAEIGLQVARFVEAQTRAEPPPPVADVALAYSRVSRAVRQTVLLQSKVLQDHDQAARAAERAHATDTPEHRRKARIERIVGRVALAEHPDDEDAVDTLLAEAVDRLDDEDLYGDLLDRPLSEIVARLCQDLGLDPDWARLREELWMQEETPNLPRKAVGGEPSAEEPMVEGASGWRNALSVTLGDISPASG